MEREILRVPREQRSERASEIYNESLNQKMTGAHANYRYIAARCADLFGSSIVTDNRITNSNVVQNSSVNASNVGDGSTINARDVNIYNSTLDQSSLTSDLKEALKAVRAEIDMVELSREQHDAVIEQLRLLTEAVTAPEPQPTILNMLWTGINTLSKTLPSLARVGELLRDYIGSMT